MTSPATQPAAEPTAEVCDEGAHNDNEGVCDACYGLGRDDEAAGRPLRRPLGTAGSGSTTEGGDSDDR